MKKFFSWLKCGGSLFASKYALYNGLLPPQGRSVNARDIGGMRDISDRRDAGPYKMLSLIRRGGY